MDNNLLKLKRRLHHLDEIVKGNVYYVKNSLRLLGAEEGMSYSITLSVRDMILVHFHSIISKLEEYDKISGIIKKYIKEAHGEFLNKTFYGL